MTTFHSQQLDRRQCIHQNANASVFQIHATNFAVKLHVHIHAARKIGCSNLSNVVQAHIIEFSFYWNQALPLVRTRILRLAQISPLDMRSLTRQSRDDCEMSGKTSDGISRRKSALCTGKVWAVKMAAPFDVRQVGLQDNSQVQRIMTRENLIINFQPRPCKIMNTPNQSKPDLEELRKAVQQCQPNPHRIPFKDLKPVHDSIVELRNRTMSYAAIAELLQQHGIKTSRARVAEYGRIVLESGKSRKRRKRLKSASATVVPAAFQSISTLNEKTVPVTPTPPIEPTNSSQPPANEISPHVTHGPRIAKVELMSPKEVAEFNASLKSKNDSKP